MDMSYLWTMEIHHVDIHSFSMTLSYIFLYVFKHDYFEE